MQRLHNTLSEMPQQLPGLHCRESGARQDPAEACRRGRYHRILRSAIEEEEKEVFEEMRRLFATIMVMLTLLTVNAYADEPKVIMDGKYVNPQANAIDISEPPPISNISKALDAMDDALDANGHQMEYLGVFTATYYDSCRKCNGKWGPIDGFGNPLEWGCVAVDPKVIPLHTKLVIDGYDIIFEARDTGSGVNGKHVDIYVPVSHEEALRMGQGEKLKVWKYTE